MVREEVKDLLVNALDVAFVNRGAYEEGDDAFGAGIEGMESGFVVLWVKISFEDNVSVSNYYAAVNGKSFFFDVC